MPWPSDVNGGKPNKEVWQTEMSGVKWWPEQGPEQRHQQRRRGRRVDSLRAAWTATRRPGSTGGTRRYDTDDNEGLHPPRAAADTKRHWTLGNYSKFVRPGYVRVDITGAPSGVLALGVQGHGRHRRRRGHQQEHVGGQPADHHRRRDGAGHDDAVGDVVDRQPHLQDRGRGERRQLHGRRLPPRRSRRSSASNATRRWRCPAAGVGGRQRPPR